MNQTQNDTRLAGQFVKTPRCDVCGAFMSTGYDDMGFPAASCQRESCYAEPYDVDTLIAEGYFEEA